MTLQTGQKCVKCDVVIAVLKTQQKIQPNVGMDEKVIPLNY
jgi:hypothetical protein